MESTILPPSAFDSREDYLAQFPSCDGQAPRKFVSALTPEQRAKSSAAIKKMLDGKPKN